MKQIILAATAVLLFTQPALAYTRMFYRVTVRVEAARSTAFMESNLPTEEIIEEEPAEALDEEIVEEAGVENTQEEKIVVDEELPEGIVSAIIGPPDGVELIQPSDLPSSIPPAQPSDPSLSTPAQPSNPPVEEGVDEENVLEEIVVEEAGVINTPEGKREEEPAEEAVVENNTPEEIIQENEENAGEMPTEEQINQGVESTPGEAK